MRIPLGISLLLLSALGALASAELAWASVAPPNTLLLLTVAACAAGLALLRPRPARGMIADRSAVRLALRLARPGQKVVLVEMRAGYRVLPLEAAALRAGRVEILASLSRGTLLLARERA